MPGSRTARSPDTQWYFANNPSPAVPTGLADEDAIRAVWAADSKSPADLNKEQTLYVVGYAHLDTEWRWEYPQVIQEYLTKTMRNNFALFEKYPHYIFNFTGPIAID